MRALRTVYGNVGSLVLLVLCCLCLGVATPGRVEAAEGQAPDAPGVADQALTDGADRALTEGAVSPPEKTPDGFARVERLEFSQTSRGPELSITGNQPLHYKIFNLSEPPRLVLVFSHARLGPMVQPMLLETDGVTGVFPSQGENGEVRLEVALKKDLTHEIVADGNRIVLTILSQIQDNQRHSEALGLDVVVEETKTTIGVAGGGVGQNPKVFRMYGPPRVVMDLVGFKGPSSSKTEKVGSAEVDSAVLVANDEKTRLIVTLKSDDIRHDAAIRRGMPALVFTRPAQAFKTSPPGQPQVEEIGFERDGEAAVIRIATSLRQTGLKVSRVDANLHLVIPGMALPQRLVRRMDVTQFAAPVTAIDTFTKSKDVYLDVRLASPTHQHEILETPREILVRVRSAKLVESEKGDAKPAYKGQRMSMDFKNIDIHNALKLVADISQLNIILADSVTGTLTMRLVDVPWDQALDLILAAKGLGKDVQGNVIRIAPLAEIQTSAEAKIKAQDSQQRLEPFVTELISVSFANAQDMVTLLKEGTSAQQGGASGTQQRGTRLLSEGGAVSLDARTSTLIVKDVASNIPAIRELIGKLDKPTSQVLIEARIVEINRNASESLGITWGASFKPKSASDFAVSDSTTNSFGAFTSDGTGSALTSTRPVMVNLGQAVNAGRMGIHLGTVSPFLDLDIELGAMEATGKGKTISSPRVLTMNNQEATITQGEKIPYSAESSSGGTTTEFVEASLQLQVTPHVTPSGFITLKVSVSNNSLGSIGSPPSINTKVVSTQALIKDSETIVLGGIFTKSRIDGSRAVPGLREIPVIGDLLFKNKNETSTETELLIFITPRIVQTGA